MSHLFFCLLIALAIQSVALHAFAEADATADGSAAVPPALDFEMDLLSGEPMHLSRYLGNVVLIVNTASKCGNTPQYEPLEALHAQYADQGLAVLGFPANNFGQQEPGSDEEIAQFCERNYGVSFDMFSKVSVKGDNQCALYQHLTSEESNPGFAGPITWNFEKFLIGRNGEVIARFAPKTQPDSEEVVAAIEAALAQPAPTTGEQGATE